LSSFHDFWWAAHDKRSAANKKICTDVLIIQHSSLLFEMANSYDNRILQNCEAIRESIVAPKIEKAESPIHLGPADSSGQATQLCLGSSWIHPSRSLAFRPTFTDGLALSIEPILAGREYMSKQKSDRAISAMYRVKG
jgi:hypothetical protein